MTSSETVLHLRVPRELAERVDRWAADKFRTRSNAVVVLTDEALRRHEDERKERA
jgi:metal-responsive CopG/Arc/MetJ family transcriptional regulator